MELVTNTSDSLSEPLWTDADADTVLSTDVPHHVSGSRSDNSRLGIGDDQFEIGDQGVWSVSSLKPGNGVDMLRDSNLQTFWQTNGQQPHHAQIQFYKRTAISSIHVHCNYRRDESYTPNEIGVLIGNDVHDLFEIAKVQLKEPEGWIKIPLTSSASRSGRGDEDYIYTFIVRIMIFSNHHNGRDSHVRQIRILSPEKYFVGESSRLFF